MKKNNIVFRLFCSAVFFLCFIGETNVSASQNSWFSSSIFPFVVRLLLFLLSNYLEDEDYEEGKKWKLKSFDQSEIKRKQNEKNESFEFWPKQNIFQINWYMDDSFCYLVMPSKVRFISPGKKKRKSETSDRKSTAMASDSQNKMKKKIQLSIGIKKW